MTPYPPSDDPSQAGNVPPGATPPPGSWAPQQQQWPMHPKTNSYALTSMILGILGIVFTGILTGIPAIIFGYSGRRQIAERQPYEDGGGMATAGIVLGWISVAITVLAIIAVIIVFAVAVHHHTTAT